MTATVPEALNVFFEDLQPTVEDSRAELLAGLQRPQKMVGPKYFYDARGSALFERITRQPEYYPTRIERLILKDYAAEMAECCGRNCVLIEPGSGSSEKVRLLLDAIQPAAYVPVDISADFLFESAVRLGRDFPWLNVHAICADFSLQWRSRATLPAGRRVIFYPGSTIGNMEPADAQIFLAELREWIGEDGGLLIGVDLHKPENLLNKAYNDAAGVTADFNLNILESVNRLASANFRPEAFSHHAYYNQDVRRIEMHLVSKEVQSVELADQSIQFRENETIHTENSYKYSVEGFRALAARAGFEIQRSWLDDQQLFSVHYLTVTAG